MNTKTFAEAEGEESFDWKEALNREDLDDEDWYYMFKLSESWVTCACGNQCAVIPRESCGEPEDSLLAGLGLAFMEAVGDENRGKALEILGHIEERSTLLIQNIQDNVE